MISKNIWEINILCDILSGDFMSYVDQFGDFMSGDFMSGDFSTGYQPRNILFAVNELVVDLSRSMVATLSHSYIIIHYKGLFIDFSQRLPSNPFKTVQVWHETILFGVKGLVDDLYHMLFWRHYCLISLSIIIQFHIYIQEI